MTRTKKSVDIFLNKLYSSNDPLCMEAADYIERTSKRVEVLEDRMNRLTLASKYMVESLFDVIAMSQGRDSRKQKPTDEELVRELGLRLKECESISRDTLRLETVVKAFEEMKD
jgi:hypothetical protein